MIQEIQKYTLRDINAVPNPTTTPPRKNTSQQFSNCPLEIKVSWGDVMQYIRYMADSRNIWDLVRIRTSPLGALSLCQSTVSSHYLSYHHKNSCFVQYEQRMDKQMFIT